MGARTEAMTPRLVLLSPEHAATSETFIRAHRERLPFEVIPLFRWRAPYQTEQGHWVALLPGVLRNLADKLKLKRALRLSTAWSAWQTARWLQATGATAVLAEYGPLGAGIAPACRKAALPLVVIFHGFDAYQETTLQTYGQAYQQLFASAAALVVVSDPMREQLIQLGAPAERIVVNACGVDPNNFPAASVADTDPIFLSIGRLVGKKGPLHTIRAFAQVHQPLPASRLTMIGAGPLLETSKALAAELGVSHAIQFLGACSHATVQAHLQHARAVVQHSMRCESGDQEGTPVALIEAQMAGVPVVATQHAGIPAVVLDGRTGFLVQEGDVDGMAEAMLKLGQDPQLAAEMGSAARADALKHHTMDRHIQSLAATIHDTINRHTAAART
jgi:glycosyltransferase involved in cell wall biosynthesis